MSNQLIGAWHLKSWTASDEKGSKLYPLGLRAQGIIIYSGDGHMSATIMNPDQLNNISEGISIRSMLSGKGVYLSYAGTYSVHGNKALHEVEISSVPEWIGTAQERFFQIEGKTLTINSETPLPDGSIIKHLLIWSKP